MTKQSESYPQAFEDLRMAFLEEVPEKIVAIRRAAEDVGQGDSQKAITVLYHLVHRLIGSTAIYGLERVSDAARPLEMCVGEVLESKTRCGPARAREIIDLVGELEQVWRQVSPPGKPLSRGHRRPRSAERHPKAPG